MMRIVCLLVLLVFSNTLFAQMLNTGKGKIVSVIAHTAQKCRMVTFSNKTGGLSHFRIDNDEGSADIYSLLLAAVTSQNDVTIFYQEELTTGCGSEPKIQYVVIANSQ